MPPVETTRWTDADFENLSWHDNAVHAMRIVEGEYGAGRLVLDLDYILEWLRDDAGAIRFRIAPATLEFHEVTHLKIMLDYATPTAGLTPFSMDRIVRRTEQRERYQAILWEIVVNWPVGSLSFEAAGFTQELRGPAVICAEQHLSAPLRGDVDP